MQRDPIAIISLRSSGGVPRKKDDGNAKRTARSETENRNERSTGGLGEFKIVKFKPRRCEPPRCWRALPAEIMFVVHSFLCELAVECCLPPFLNFKSDPASPLTVRSKIYICTRDMCIRTLHVVSDVLRHRKPSIERNCQALHLPSRFTAPIMEIFTEATGVLYMQGLVMKTGTSLPSRTRQFLALQITFCLKLVPPLSSSFSSLPERCSRFLQRVTACAQDDERSI